MRMRRPLPLVLTIAVATVVSVPAAALAAPGGAGHGPAVVNVAHQAARLRPHAVSAAGARASLAQTAAGAAFSKITSAGRVSRDTLPSSAQIEPDTQIEPDVTIDPGNPRIITAAFQQGRNGPFGGSADGGYATSQDGGRTWADGNLPMLTTVVGGPFQLASDTAVAFGPDGSDYVSTIPFDETDPRSAVAVQRSTDGGVSFGPPSLVVDDNNVNIFNDKEWVAADTFRHSPHFGRIYAAWSRFITTGSGASAVTTSPGAVSFSDNQGKTWSPIHFTTPVTADTEGLIPLVHPDGSITVVYDRFVPSPTNPNQGNDYETAQTSHDGGVAWSPPVTIGQFLGSGVPGMRTGGLPAAAVDPANGHMYAVWQDTRFNPSGLNDIVLSVSADGGAKWSAPRVVNPKVAGLDRFTPAVAADAGAVHVTYLTRGANGTSPSVSEDYIASADGGRTFGFEHRIGPPIVLKWAAVSDEALPPVAFLGDYMGLAAAPGSAEILWCVSSTPPVSGTFYQTAWGAKVTR
jgi:hypothetical protein